MPLNVHSTKQGELEAGERLVASLRVALEDLLGLYSTILSDKLRPRADFPFRNFFLINGQKHYFTYDGVVENKRVFLAHLNEQPNEHLYVKFSQRYSEDAHRAALKLGLAPKLYAVNEVYGWFLVVMEDVSKNYTPLSDLTRLSAIGHVRRELAPGLGSLHEEGFVHGDVRDVNILVRRPDVDQSLRSVLLVDWDWAGKEGEAKYPHSMNPEVLRPSDAVVGGRITAKHDKEMAERL